TKPPKTGFAPLNSMKQGEFWKNREKEKVRRAEECHCAHFRVEFHCVKHGREESGKVRCKDA
ncbi:hypothetical protein AVEN_77433-1, partial [Araneus ventricosus]